MQTDNPQTFVSAIEAETPKPAPVVRPAPGGLVFGTVTRWLGLGVSMLTGFLVAPVIVRALGNERYGLWSLAASFVGFYGLFDLGLGNAVSRFMGKAIGARDMAELNRVASAGKWLLTGASGLLFLFAILVMRPAAGLLHIPPEHLSDFRWLLVLSAISMSISIATATYSGALLAAQDFVTSSLINTVSGVLRSLGGLVVVLAGGGVVGLGAVGAICTALGQSAVYARSRWLIPQMKPSLKAFHFSEVRSLASFGGATLVAKVAEVLRSKLDVALVTRFAGISQAGIYGVGLVVFQHFFSVAVTTASICWPRLNVLHGSRDTEALRSFFVRASRLIAAFVAFSGGLLVGLVPILMSLWMGEGYEASATVVRILVLGFVVDLATNPGIGSLYATGQHKYFAAQTVVEGIASLSLAFAGAVRYGMVGVAVGMVIPITIIRLTVQPWYVTRNLGIGMRRYWLRTIAIPVLTMGGLAAGLGSLKHLSQHWGWWAVPTAGLAVTLASATGLWYGVVEHADRVTIVHRAAGLIARLRCRFRSRRVHQVSEKDYAHQ